MSRRLAAAATDVDTIRQRIQECADGVCKSSGDAVRSDEVCGKQTWEKLNQCPDQPCVDKLVANANVCVSWGNFVSCADEKCFGSNSSTSSDGNQTVSYNGNQTVSYNGNQTGASPGSGSYSGSGSSNSGGNQGEDFATIMKKLGECVENVCTAEAVNATADTTCGASEFANLMACTEPRCLDSVAKSPKCESFKAFVMCAGTKCFNDNNGGGGGGSQGVPDANSCPVQLASYCTAHPEDESCALPCPFNCYLQPNCPCQDNACTAAAAAPFCVREDGVCAQFKSALAKAEFSHGAFNPTQEWQRQQVAQYLVAPTPYDPSNDTALRDLWQQCNQVWPNLADNIASCLNTSIQYCNRVGWDQTKDRWACLSTCQPEDPTRFACLEQGKACIACTRPWVQYGSNGQPLTGQFCTNDRLVVDNVTIPSPIYYPSCSSINNIQDAIDCDIYANTFCANLTVQGTSDPACQPYVNLTRKYTVPTVAQSCEYQIKNIEIGAQAISSAKVDMPRSLPATAPHFQDPYGLLSPEDATPIFKFKNPYTSLPKTWKDKITANATVSAIMNTIYGSRNDMFYSLKDLRLTDFFQYAFPEFYMKDGQIPFNQPQLARLTTDLIPLPPTSEPTKWAMKAILMKFRYDGLAWNDWSKKEFAKFNAWEIDGGSDYQDATLHFGVLLSTSNRDGDGKIQENVQRMCSDKGCANEQCEYKVDHCRSVPLTTRTLSVNKAKFANAAAKVVDLASSIDQAKSWEDLVGNTVKVAIEASSEAFTDPVSLFWKLVVKGKQTKFLKNVPNYCKHNYYNDTSYWTADPCCNWEMRQYLCCAPQDIPNGEIDVVVSTADSEISTYCPGVGAQVRDVVQSTMKALQRAGTCSADLDSSTGYDSWKTMSTVSETCRNKIQKAGSVDCKKDSDCTACSQSTCQRDRGAKEGSGKCTVPWDDMEGCTLECYQKSMDSELLRYLYDQWDLSVTATADEKKAKFTEMMSEPTCSGPQAWQQDIGYNGWIWKMNTTCQSDHICDDWDYQYYLQNVANQQSSNGYWGSWLDFRNNDTCAQYNGTMTCTSQRPDGGCYDWGYQCTFDHVRGPCKDVNMCYQQCQAPYTESGCASLNGTWFKDPNNPYSYGQCCPPDAYFNVSGTNSMCSYAPPNSPNSWSVNDETCCRAAKGVWWTQVDYNGNSNGQCCFGKLRPYADYQTGKTMYQCQQDFWGWDNSECYEQCNALQQSCTQCKLDSASCQGMVHNSANKTACLSYKTCNQGQYYQEEECQRHVGDEPFCAQCWGSWCYKQGSPATCTLYAWGTESCESAGGVWDWSDYRCHVNGTQANLDDPWSCFTPGPSVCPDPTNNSRAYGPGEVVPKYSFRDNQCEAYVCLDSVTLSDCTSDTYSSIRWKPLYGNGTGACAIETWQISADDCADKFSGVYVKSTIAYNGGQFNTKDKCDQGGLGWDGWSRQQCEETPKYQCSQQCEQCVTWNWPYYAQDGGGCFSSNATYCQDLGYSDVPVRVLGECNDWDSMRQECSDDGWTYGDQCYAYWTEDVFDSTTNSSVSQWKNAYCTSCQYIDGVCVVQRPLEGCKNNMWHSLGCRVDGIHNETACYDFDPDAGWLTKAKTKEECLGLLRCDEPGYYGQNNKNAEECAKCGGTGKPYFTWWGGVWSRPYVQDLKWMANGTQLISVNQWKPAIADYKVQEQLALPMVRKLANAKKTQTLLSKAIVQKNCSTSGRRRLADGAPAAGDDKLAITTTYYSAGPFANAYEPFCSATDRMQRNPLAVRNTKGVVVGQLMGDGKGLSATSSFSSISVCLEMSLDIRVVDKRFPVYDVAVLVDGTFTPLYLTSFVSLNAQSMCFLAKQNGIYFPITRLALASTALNAITCANSCKAENSICVYSGVTNTTSCMCNCGYSGETCDIGCINQCSSQGTCTNNVCTCQKGFTGADCSEYDCPVANGKKCSGNGVCNSNATCTCSINFKGDDCSQPKVTQTKTIVLPKGLTPAATGTARPTGKEAQPSTTTAKPATFAPAPPLTPAPPLPTIASTCAASKCKADFDTCMATFDSCACLPGQLLCIQSSCSSEFDVIVNQCKGLVPQAVSCVLECSPKPYPVKGDTSSNTVMAVVASIALKGVTAAQFSTAVQDKFKQAIASSIAGVTADKISITKVTDVPDARRRLEQAAITADGRAKVLHGVRQLAGTHLEIEFSIFVSSPEALKTTTASMQGTAPLVPLEAVAYLPPL
ncbi:hypothetical protein DYB32_004579 [Aphanomyces invadans]|uniref:EGF-like domain-containing protein n=1 Tax=Aphanomyces invadans TaxID=157072 RepID=A0A3R6Y9F9_9STRA|nr:hypothetical protein DYB32_004579 [Aphanomyces invadans]